MPVDRRLGRGRHTRIAVQPEVIVAGEVDQIPIADGAVAARHPLMRAEKRIGDAQGLGAGAHHRQLARGGQGGEVSPNGGAGGRRVATA